MLADGLILRAWCLPMSRYATAVCRAVRSRVIIAASRTSGPVFETTISEAVAAPTDKRGLFTSEYPELVRQPHMVLGGDGAIRKDARTASDVCFNIPAHPLRLKPQTVALVTPEGAKTMTSFTRAQAAPADLPTTDPRLFCAAINGLAHALRILTDGDLDQSQLQRAIGKATRAATAMKRMAQTTAEG